MAAAPLPSIGAAKTRLLGRDSWLRMAWGILTKKPGRLIGLGIVVLFFLMATVGPLLYPANIPMNPTLVYAAPSWAHPLGTDFEGSDVVALLVTGSRYVLESAFLAALFTVGFGTLFGLVAGYSRGFADSAIMRVTDFILTLPGFPLLVVLSTLWDFGSPLAMGFVLGITGWGGIARAVRSQTLSVRERGFIESARALGVSDWRIIWREIFPNVAPYIAMNFLVGVTGSIYAEVGLFFLGVVPFSVNNWGVMLNLAFFQAGAMYTTRSLLYLISPIACILLLTLGVVLLLDAVDEILNPRLREA